MAEGSGTKMVDTLLNKVIGENEKENYVFHLYLKKMKELFSQ